MHSEIKNDGTTQARTKKIIESTEGRKRMAKVTGRRAVLDSVSYAAQRRKGPRMHWDARGQWPAHNLTAKPAGRHHPYERMSWPVGWIRDAGSCRERSQNEHNSAGHAGQILGERKHP